MIEIVELINKWKKHGFLSSGTGPSHHQCPNCDQEYANYKRSKDFIYRCNDCGHIFDIYGKEIAYDGLNDGGVFYFLPEPKLPIPNQ